MPMHQSRRSRPCSARGARHAATARVAAVVAVVAAMAAFRFDLPWPVAHAAGDDAAQAGTRAPAVFGGADLEEGKALIEQHKCEACHTRKVGGDGSAIYRPKGRISSPAFLRGMVEYCNTELGLQLFPEEVTSIGAVLNRDHYRFD